MPRINFIPDNVFRFTITTGTPNFTINQFMQGVINKSITIHYGDGSETSVNFLGAYQNNIQIDHTYAVPGTYYCFISGDVSSITNIWWVNFAFTFKLSSLPRNLIFLGFTSATCTGSIKDLPKTLEGFHYTGNASPVTGDLNDFSKSLRSLFINGMPLITGNIQDLPSTITQLNLYSNANITGNLDNLFPNLSYLTLSTLPAGIYGNISLFPSTLRNLSLAGIGSNLTGSIDSLSKNMVYCTMYDCSSTFTGSISTLSTSLNTLTLQNLGTGLTGSVSALPATCTKLNLTNLGSNITGNIGDMHANFQTILLTGLPSVNYTSHSFTILQGLYLKDCNQSQAEVDQALHDAVLSGITARYTLMLDGASNAAPSAAGYTDKATLASRTWYVYTN
jgi:hypothetical protein